MTQWKPVIGITAALNDEETRISVNRNFQEVLLAAGAMPVILPITADPEALETMIDRCDGIVFSGGGDVNPLCFGEQPRPCLGDVTPDRDACELPLAKLLHDRHDKPVLGVCRGAQVLNVALGGTVFQDIATDFGKSVIAHRQKQLGRYASHTIALKKGSLIQRIMEADCIQVNSFHHQAADKISPAMAVTASAPDGITECVESTSHPFYLGVQWHPEIMWRNDEKSMQLFRALVVACVEMHK